MVTLSTRPNLLNSSSRSRSCVRILSPKTPRTFEGVGACSCVSIRTSDSSAADTYSWRVRWPTGGGRLARRRAPEASAPTCGATGARTTTRGTRVSNGWRWRGVRVRVGVNGCRVGFILYRQHQTMSAVVVLVDDVERRRRTILVGGGRDQRACRS